MLFPTAQMEVRMKNGTSKKARILEIKKDECKLVDANKYVTNELTLEHTPMRAWSMDLFFELHA